MTTIVLADDHELIRESIASLLREVPNFKIVGQCANGRQLIKQVESFHPNVVIVDVSMPELNGIDAARQIRKISPKTRIVAISLYSDDAYIQGMINAGACAYIIKSGAATDLVEAIRKGSKGKVYFSYEISERAGKIQFQANKFKNKISCSEPQLTPREREVLQLIGEGYSSKEIANTLKICETTVKTHRNSLMDKLNVRDIAGLTRESIRLKLVKVDGHYNN